MGDPRKKNPPDHPQAENGLSHVTQAWLEIKSGETTSDLEQQRLAVLTIQSQGPPTLQ